MNLKLRSVIAVNYLVNLPMWRDNEGLVKLRELYIYNGVLYLKLVESKQSCSPESNGKEPKHICGAHRTSHGLHLAQWRPSTRLERPCHHDRAPAISKSNKKSKIDKKKHQNLGMTRKKVPLLLPQAHIVERFTCRGTTGWADEQLVILRRALTRAAWQLISRAQTSLGCLCCQEMMHRRPVAGPLQMRSPIWGMLVWYRRDRKMASAASPQTVRSRRWAVVAPAHGNHDEGRRVEKG